MKPEEVPADLIRIATEGLMGLEVRRVIANVWPEIERRVREQVAAESAVLVPADLAALLNYVVGRDGIRVVDEATLDRAFAALKATQPAETARGES